MKLGVIGTSWISDSFLESAKIVNKFDFEAVASPRIESVEKFQKKYGFKEIYTDVSLMAENSKLDVVYIATPNSFHYEQTKLFLNKKVNVICEKPITLSRSELIDLKETALLNGVFFIEAMRPLHHPNLKKLKEFIDDIKPFRHASFQFMRYSSKYDAYKNGEKPKVFLKEFGGGAVNDLGVYTLTTALYLFGKPLKVTSDSVILDTMVDASTVITLNYGTFLVTCSSSKVSNSYLMNEIQGEKESILLNHVTHLDKIIKVNDEGSTTLLDDRIAHDMQYEIKDFLSIIENKDIQMFEEYLTYTLDVLEVIDKIRIWWVVKENHESCNDFYEVYIETISIYLHTLINQKCSIIEMYTNR